MPGQGPTFGNQTNLDHFFLFTKMYLLRNYKRRCWEEKSLWMTDPLSQRINPVSIVTAGDLAEAITDDTYSFRL